MNGPEGGPVDPATGLPVGPAIPETWQEKAPKDISFKNLPCGEVVRLLREYFPKMNFIMDPELDVEVRSSEFLSRSRNTPFAGWKLKGGPVMTVVKGRIVWSN